MSLVEVRREAQAAVVRYANPPLGTMTAAGAQEMYDAVRAAAEDPAVRAIIITGGLPDIFIRHYDVGELTVLGERLASAPPPAQPPGANRPAGGFLGLTDLVAAAPKPVIAAINGLCMGGGFELSLACDIRIAGRSVTAIGLPETRVGIFPGGGGTQRLPRVIGEARALEMILRGRVVTGEAAAAIGLVHEAADDPLARALEIAAEFAARPPEGLAYAKRLTRAALDRPLVEGLADERTSFAEVVRLPSAIEAMRASLAGAPLGTREPS
ncbi:MAG TPA: enoyl-CoA hydratase/isomerase family protein [Caulobacteraceae bacterium]|nr:enoyl-CoA hydratase/isomerase family protein [Caulobacteraceae bacterium]